MTDLEKRAVCVERLARAEKISRIVLTLAVLMTMLTVPASGAGSQISSAVSNGMKSVYGVITSVIMPIATVVFAFAAAKLLFGGQRAMEQGQGKLLTILLVLAGVYLAPIIIEEVAGWVKNLSTSTGVWTTG